MTLETPVVELVGGPLCGLKIKCAFEIRIIELPVPAPKEPESSSIMGFASYEMEWVTPTFGKGIYCGWRNLP